MLQGNFNIQIRMVINNGHAPSRQIWKASDAVGVCLSACIRMIDFAGCHRSTAAKLVNIAHQFGGHLWYMVERSTWFLNLRRDQWCFRILDCAQANSIETPASAHIMCVVCAAKQWWFSTKVPGHICLRAMLIIDEILKTAWNNVKPRLRESTSQII